MNDNGNQSPEISAAATTASRPRTGVRVMVILNNKRPLEGALYFLERRGYNVYTVGSVGEAVRLMGNFKPHVVLLSWNLKRTDAKRAYRVLTETFNLVSIVFAEENKTRTTAALMSSGIPHALLPPVSGPSIHMRIQALLRTRIASTAAKRREFARKMSQDGMPPNLVWKKSDQVQADGVPKWEAKHPENPGKVYYFKGPTPPQFDPVRQAWNFSDEEPKGNQVNMFARDPIADDFSATQEGVIAKGKTSVEKGRKKKGYTLLEEGKKSPEYEFETSKPGEADLEASLDNMDLDDAGFNWSENSLTAKEIGEIENAEKEAATVDDENTPVPEEIPAAVPVLESQEPEQPEYEYEKTSDEGVLLQAVKAAAKSVCGELTKPRTRVGLVSIIYPVLVRTGNFSGYLYLAISSDRDDETLFEEFGSKLAKELASRGEVIEEFEPLVSFDIEPLPFMKFFYEKGKFVFQTAYKKESLGFAFMEVARLPRTQPTDDPGVISVSLADDIVGGEELMFDLFLHLPRNKKFILYLNAGNALSTKSLQKFLGFGIKYVQIRKNHRVYFLSYCARNLIKTQK